MEPVLLGLAAPAAVGQAGSVIERTLDTLAIPFAAVLNAVAETLAPAEEVQEEIQLDDLRSNFDALQSDLAQRILGALASAGIKLDEPLELRISEFDGRLEVVGDHPQKALIESALADDENLEQDFTAATALFELLSAINAQEGSGDSDVTELGDADDDEITARLAVDEGEVSFTFQ